MKHHRPVCPPRISHIPSIQNHLSTPSTSALFLSGASSTGKHITLLSSLPHPPPSITTVDCVQSHSDRLLFGALTSSTPCDLSDFLSRITSSTTATILLLLRAERLTTPAFSSSTAPLLLSLPKLAQRSDLHVVFLSRAPWPVFRRALPAADAASFPDPLALFFAPYSTKDASAAIASQPPSDDDDNLFPGFVTAVVDALYPSTNDLPELTTVCNALFPRYVAAWRAATDPSLAAAAAFNEVNALLAAALRDLYRAQHGVPRDHVLQRGRRRREAEQGEGRRAREGLSKSSITMLVAAFLAGRNPPATDGRYFTAERTRRARKGRGRASAGKRARVGSAGANTRAFPLERMLAIFEAVRDVDDLLDARDEGTSGAVSAALSTSTLVQISTLVRLEYLSREGAGDPLAEPKYRCNVTQEQATEFARLVGVELEQFLYVDSAVA